MRELMFSCSVALLVFSLANFLHDVSSCDQTCADKPFFNVSRLIVKHGDPTAATCFLCQSCQGEIFELEKSLGSHTKNGSTILWVVDRMTEWDTSALCYLSNSSDNQCCSKLPVIAYKPPDDVFLSFSHSGPLLEGHQYTLQCEVQNVAPVENVTVIFYKGQTPLGHLQSNNTNMKKPTTETFTMDIVPSMEDNVAQFWCEAKLELGTEGPQHPPVVVSKKLNSTVHYKPRQQGPPHPDPITVTQGRSLELSCVALGNPGPSYTWTALPSALPPSNSSILNITSVDFKHGGQYVCSVRNEVGVVTVLFNVVVKANVIPYTSIAIAIAFALVTVLAIIGGVHCYKQNRKGSYDLMGRPRPQKQNLPTSNRSC